MSIKNWLGKKKSRTRSCWVFLEHLMCGSRKKKFGGGGVKYEGYLSLAVRGGVPSHIFL